MQAPAERQEMGHHLGYLPTIAVLGFISSLPRETGLRNYLGWLGVRLEEVLIFSPYGPNMKYVSAQGLKVSFNTD